MPHLSTLPQASRPSPAPWSSKLPCAPRAPRRGAVASGIEEVRGFWAEQVLGCSLWPSGGEREQAALPCAPAHLSSPQPRHPTPSQLCLVEAATSLIPQMHLFPPAPHPAGPPSRARSLPAQPPLRSPTCRPHPTPLTRCPWPLSTLASPLTFAHQRPASDRHLLL